MNRLPYSHSGAPRRYRRTALKLAGIISLSFLLGALVSVWLFNRAGHTLLLARPAAAAANTTVNFAATNVPATTSVNDQPVTQSAPAQAFTPSQPLSVAAKRSAPTERRTLAAPATVPNDKAAHTHSPVSPALASPSTPPQTAHRADAAQPISAARDNGGRGCMLSTSKSKLTLHGKNAATDIAVSLGNLTAPAVNATTGDWAHIVVFPGARRAGVSTYRIVSVGQRPGTYSVTFTSPCGAKRIAVTVE